MALGSDLTYGLLDNISRLLGLNLLELESDGTAAPPWEAPPAARAAQAKEAVREYAAGIARVKESHAFRMVDDGRTPLLCLLLQGRSL